MSLISYFGLCHYILQRAKEQIDHDELVGLYQKPPIIERICATGVSNSSYDTNVIHINSVELMVKNKQQKINKNILKQKFFAEKEFFKGRKKSLDKEDMKASSAEKELDKERKISFAQKELHKERATQIK